MKDQNALLEHVLSVAAKTYLQAYAKHKENWKREGKQGRSTAAANLAEYLRVRRCQFALGFRRRGYTHSYL